MGSSGNNKASELLDRQKKQRVWLVTIICLAAVVILGTVAMLRYIGRAMTQDLTCGIEEHTHSEECYTSEAAADGSAVTTLTCGKEEHVHIDECYTQKKSEEDAYDEEKVTAMQARFDALPEVEAYLALNDTERTETDTLVDSLFKEYEQFTENERNAVNVTKGMAILGCNRVVEEVPSGAAETVAEIATAASVAETTAAATSESAAGATETVTAETKSTAASGNTTSTTEMSTATATTATTAGATDDTKATATTAAATDETKATATTETVTAETKSTSASETTATESLKVKSASRMVSVSNDLEPYVTDVYGTGTVFDSNTGLLKETGLTIEITVPASTVSENGNLMVYNYPLGIIVPDELLNDSISFYSGGSVAGSCVFGDNGDGTYCVTVRFDESFVNGISGDISGYVKFDGYMNEYATDNKGNVSVDFSDNCQLYVEGGTIEYKENKTLFYDITTSKTGSYSTSDDTLIYTVKVSSVKGTPDIIDITDTLNTSGLVLSGPESVTVTYSTGKVITLSDDKFSVEKNNNSDSNSSSVIFTAEIPGLSADSYCELTYTYKIESMPTDKEFTPGNTFTASSEDVEKGELIKSSSSYAFSVEKDYKLEKNGSYQNKKIEWTIKINENNRNIAGGTLTDTMFGELTDKDFTIEPSEGYSIVSENGKITGIKFSGIDGTVNKNCYVIKYSTDVAEGYESQSVYNRAEFDKDGDGKYDAYAEKTVNVTGGTLNKKAEGATVSDDGKTAEVTWNVTIGVKDSGIKEGTLIDDRTFEEGGWSGYKTADEHYMTVSQVCEWAGKLSWNNSNKEINAADGYIELTLLALDGNSYSYADIGNVPSDTKFSGWTITVLKDIAPPAGSDSLVLTYKTTADISNAADGSNRYYNTVYSGNLRSADLYTYEKGYVVKKGKGDSGFTADDTTITNSDGELVWTVEAELGTTGEYSEITFTDNLPDGVILENLYVSAQNNYWSDFGLSIDEDNGVISGSNYALTTSGTYDKASGEVKLTIKPLYDNTYRGNTKIIVTYSCKTDDATFKNAKEHMEDGFTCQFTNKVRVDTDKGSYGSDENTLEWSYTDGKVVKKLLDKSGNYDGTTNELNYTVVINPDGKDLLEGKDTLELTDILSYADKDGNAKLRQYTLMGGTVKLYKAVETSDGEYIAGDAISNWTWTAETVEKDEVSGNYYDFGLGKWVDYTGHNIECVINAVIPDSTPLIFQYTYIVYAETSQSDMSVISWDIPISLGVTNTVTLEGLADYTEIDNKNVSYKDALASAGFNGVRTYTFNKVEAGNYGVTLSGAEFSAYEAGNSASVKTYNTNAGGSFQITLADGYEKDKLYYVTEIKAPVGYKLPEQPEKYYFYFSEKTLEELKENGLGIPDGVTAVNLMETGMTQNVENEKVPTTTIDVSKVWLDANGSEAVNTPDGITFVLYRSTRSVIQSVDEAKEEVGRYILKKDSADVIDGSGVITHTEDWSATLSGLPVYNEDDRPFYYWVVEEDVAGYAAEYSYGLEPLTEGSIVITNRPYTYSLPKTGSVGTLPLYAAGTGLLAAAWGMFDIKVRKQKKVKGNTKQNKTCKKGIGRDEM